MKMIYHANINQKESEMAMLITDKVDFRGKKTIRDRKEQQYIKGPVHHKDVAILHVREPNKRATNYVKQKLIELKGDIDKSTTRHLNTPLSGALEQLDRKPTRI